MNRSHYQQAIISSVTQGQGHEVIGAVAGSGKTTTLIDAACEIPHGTTAVCVAALREITNELGRRLKARGSHVEARGIHSLGRSLIADAIEPSPDVKDQKYQWLAKDLLEKQPALWRGNGYDDAYAAQRVLKDLVDFARLTLTLPTEDNLEAFIAKADMWGLECPTGFAGATEALLKQGALRAQRTGLIDFTDMLYLPLRWGLKPDLPFDWLLCDEIQDFNAAQRELILAHASEDTRGIWVGDARQAVMGFAYAEWDSWAQVQRKLGAEVLPLSICYRCPPNHLDLVRDIVPSIEAVDLRAAGPLSRIRADEVTSNVQIGDMILCRRTSPLIRLAAQLIKAGIGARIRGRDFAASLQGQLKKLAQGGFNLPASQLRSNLSKWYLKELTKLEGREAGRGPLERLAGQRDVLEAILDCAEDLNGCLAYLDKLFDERSGQVWLSSIHRAKGLEAERVIVLEADVLGQGWPKQRHEELIQEQNLRYVGLTRSKYSLILASSPPREKEVSE